MVAKANSVSFPRYSRRTFFKNYLIVDQVSEPKQKEKAANDIVKTDIWFKFKEGYSNAVRRTLKTKDLL